MARIYIETTVVSFYFNVRTEPEMVARENWTRRWLDAALSGADELVTSLAVTHFIWLSHRFIAAIFLSPGTASTSPTPTSLDTFGG